MRSNLRQTFRAARTPIWIGSALMALLLTLTSLSSARAGEMLDDAQTVLMPLFVRLPQNSSQGETMYASGQVIVGVRRVAVGAAALADSLQAQVIQEFEMTGVDAYLIRTPPGQEWAVIDQLLADPAVAFAEPNWVVRAAEFTEHAENDGMPFHVNDPFYLGHQWYLQRIQASRGWALSGQIQGQEDESITAAVASTDIQVAVIDSGVEGQHPDLKDNMSLQFRNYVNPGQLPEDDCGHGTHVAGLIGAGINNGLGVAGLAANVSIVPFKTLKLVQNPGGSTSCTGYLSDVVQAIEKAVDLGVDIINLSLELDVPSSLLEDAVNDASEQGVLLIAAAGNCKEPACPRPVQYPAAYPAVLAVAATDYFNDRAFYSSVGPQLDLAAPGGENGSGILSTWSTLAAKECPSGYRSVDGWGYCEDIGTSMSAGIVSGAAALIWSERPSMTADDVRAVLLQTARRLPLPRDQVGEGLLDLESALRYSRPSELLVWPREIEYLTPVTNKPFETILSLENPSLEPITWTITGTDSIPWLDVTGPVTGTVRYGEPVRVPIVISATHVLSGTYRGSFTVEGLRRNGSLELASVSAELGVYTPTLTPELFLPLSGQSPYVKPARPYVDYDWEEPDLLSPGAMGRTEHTLPKGSSIGITLPVTITVGGEEYTDARIYANGRLVLPASANLEDAGNRCLPFASRSALAVFAWNADLDPSRSGGRVSSFQAAEDRYVVEFDRVHIRSETSGGFYDQRVSFQITLFANGRVQLNYRETPAGTVLQPTATVGVQRLDGLFYSQLGCANTDVEVGELPSSYQSVLFREGDLY